MKVNPSIFREYDIRGRAGVDYDETFVEVLGRAYGSRLRRGTCPKPRTG